eukprot:scaffold123775_cov67-Attheya_sp.AAC.1
MDLKHMQRNGGFEVTLATEVKHKTKVHPVIDVVFPCMPGDQTRYKMKTTDKVPEEYLGRALLITGPSVNVISKDHEKSAVKFNDVA